MVLNNEMQHGLNGSLCCISAFGLCLVEFSMPVEEEFDLVVPDEVSDTIHTVHDAVQPIQKLIS